MIYKFRVILDATDDIFRDIEVESATNLEEFHDAITQAFGFDGNEMASFYLSDEEWNQGEEISLFDVSEGNTAVRLMNSTILTDIISEDKPHLIYVYDFFSMWTFFVELAEVAEADGGKTYPNLMFGHGILPDAPPEKKFEADSNDDDPFQDLDADSFGEEGYQDHDDIWN